MLLNTTQKKLLKTKAHALKPIVFIGNHGFSENVKNEINRGLDDHELIKIRIQENDRELRRELFYKICETVSAEEIQFIGKTAVIYRKNIEKQPTPKRSQPLTKKQAAKNKLRTKIKR